MAKYKGYTGSIEVIAGLKQKSGDFPLMDGHDILMGDNGERLPGVIEGLDNRVKTLEGTMPLDTSLSKTGKAADAEATGTAIKNAKDATDKTIQDMKDTLNEEYQACSVVDDGDGNVIITSMSPHITTTDDGKGNVKIVGVTI